MNQPTNITQAPNLMDIEGFTLLEILVATFILGIVVATIFTTFSESIKNINYTESRAELYQMARITLKRIQEDLECTKGISQAGIITPQPTFQPFLGTNEEIDDRRADTLSFISTKHLTLDTGNGYSGQTGISFYLKESEEENNEEGKDKGFVLYRSDTEYYKDLPEPKTGGLILCEGIHSMRFKYYDAGGDEHESWDAATGPFKDKLPVMVSIRLEFPDDSNPDTPIVFETGVAVPMAGK